MKILNFMKRYGKMPLGISIGGFFFVNKKIFIRMMSGFYSFLSTLIQLNTTNNKKTCHSRQFLNVTSSIRKAAWYINFVWWPCGKAIAYHPRGSGFEPGSLTSILFRRDPGMARWTPFFNHPIDPIIRVGQPVMGSIWSPPDTEYLLWDMAP